MNFLREFINTILDKLSPEEREIIRRIGLFGGAFLIILSAYLYIDPLAIRALTGFEEKDIRIIAIAFLAVGIIDVTASLIVFRKKDKK